MSETDGTRPATAVSVRNLNKQFGSVTALKDVTLDVPEGSIFGFIGPSGCGKTTTVRVLIGNYEPTSGEVSVLNTTPSRFSRAQQKQIGYMPQLFILYPELTVWENLNFAASLYGYSLRRRKRLRELLELVELAGHEKKLVRDISGGMQRRLSLATTLIHNPSLIFLDEPTAGIDPVLRRKFWDFFRTLVDGGRTMFVTTQYVGEAAHCDFVGVMANGQVLMVETPDNLRRKGMGGDLVHFETSEPLTGSIVAQLQELPFVNGRPLLLDSHRAELLVNDAGHAIPELLAWGAAHQHPIQSISEYTPPFDDVFVEIMEAHNAAAAEPAGE